MNHKNDREQRDTSVTEKVDYAESLRINGIGDRDSFMRSYLKICGKVGRPPN